MSQNRKWIQIVIMILFVAIVAFVLWNFLFQRENAFLKAEDLLNKSAPEFTVQSLDGKTRSLTDYKGKPVLLNFWASWCAPCRSEMPLISKKMDKYEKDGLTVLAVNLAESPQTIRAFVKEYDIQFPILLDAESTIANAYGIDPIPTTFFIDRKGKVARIYIGELEEKVFDSYLSVILK